jgi:hypothetical protein
MDSLDSGNGNKAKLIRMAPIMIYIGTQCGENAKSALFIYFISSEII